MTDSWPMNRPPIPRDQALAAFAELLAGEATRMHRAGRLPSLSHDSGAIHSGTHTGVHDLNIKIRAFIAG